ncbi:major facilitator superfamily domain-containing protein [Lasiosphaeria miniovina]|uniref:Major facilitator superfamily domain-containing protein n=1 Tax=Lasiosphaeria miniovina TaxID=1954250 RepID=A0AA40A4K9_9PEZI|nr:major facilitator superfamily domain-containing protein [Lasiosphaeria miniovina]KAK0709211.1 major facilitator superfamily domain-containing protein [Lasiosphaeria miniovina]
MHQWRKWTAIGSVCFFGSLSSLAEVIIGSLVPLFLLFYSGVDVRILNTADFQKISGGSATGVNPLAIPPEGTIPTHIGKVSLLATLPLLSNGIASSILLVPLSIAVGRRPVLLFARGCACSGGFWAAASSSLDSHLAAFAVQGLGAGAIEALIPLVIQDMDIIITDWRWLYYITSGLGVVAWLLLLLFLPETWMRSKEGLSGRKLYPLKPGRQNRPELDYKEAGLSMLDALRTAFFPAVVWATVANSIFVWTGLSVLPFIAVTGLVYLFGGPIADRIASSVARSSGGSREPEHHLLNMAAPLVFGISPTNGHCALLLAGSFMIIFGFLVAMSTLNVFIVESYPMCAGPVLVNVSIIRIIVGFFLGFFSTFALYGEVMIVASLSVPVLYFFGKRIRQWTGRRVPDDRREAATSELINEKPTRLVRCYRRS